MELHQSMAGRGDLKSAAWGIISSSEYIMRNFGKMVPITHVTDPDTLHVKQGFEVRIAKTNPPAVAPMAVPRACARARGPGL